MNTPEPKSTEPLEGLARKKRHQPLSAETIQRRFRVDIDRGKVYWTDAMEHHHQLANCEAGTLRRDLKGKCYWHIKINGLAYRRSMIIFFVAHGRWPEKQIDHINGDSLDDRASNLREATNAQNAWNHKGRAKRSPLPMGVRQIGRRFQARISAEKTMHYLGMFDTAEAASAAYQRARVEYFGEFA